jgi:hypothetical protein
MLPLIIMKKTRPHPKASSGQPFTLPPDVTFHKEPWGTSWAYVFRHRTLGQLGRIVLQNTTDGHCLISCEVAGDPADPMTARRAEIFKPLAMELTDQVQAAAGPAPANIFREALPRPPEALEMIQSKHMQCERCDAMVAMLIFAPDATDLGRFEDYARKMYPEYTRRNLPTWIIGPPQGSGPLIDRPSDILQVWPERACLQRLRPAEFNPLLDRLVTDPKHCQRK